MGRGGEVILIYLLPLALLFVGGGRLRASCGSWTMAGPTQRARQAGRTTGQHNSHGREISGLYLLLLLSLLLRISRRASPYGSRLTRPFSSMSVTLTQIISPMLTTSSTLATRWLASLEMWTRPSLPGASSTKAPNCMIRTTLPK